MKSCSYKKAVQFVTILLALSCFPELLLGQTFQRTFGTSLDNTFGKVIEDGSFYYVLGQDETINGSPPNATVTRLDASGIEQWTLTLNTPSIWNDATLTPSGDLLVVGATLPFDALNQSLIGLVSPSGGGTFTWVRSYDVTGRESITRIARNPLPENPAFPYYLVGSQWDPTGGPIWDDSILMNINEAGTFNWKKRFADGDDDEFARDLEVMPNGDMIITGNKGSQGVIIWIDNAGTLLGGATPDGLSFSYADIAPISTGGFYAVGGTFPAFTAYLMKYDADLITLWDATLTDLTAVNQIWTGPGATFYVTGRGVFDGLSRSVVLHFMESGNAPVLQWVKYLDNGESSYIGGTTTFLPPGQIAFADSRFPTSGGFGEHCAFIAVSDLQFNTCMTVDDNVDVQSLSLTYSAPFVSPIEFFDFPTGTDIPNSTLNWQQQAMCSEPCQADFIITPVGNCGQYQVTNTSTGVQPLTYMWCNGSSSEHLNVMLPCGPHTFCLTITDANNCTSSYEETITVTDNIPPIAVCALPFGVVLDANCTYTLSPSQIDGGSSDNCQILSVSISPAVLTGCGVFPVTLTVTDWCGNTSTCATMIQTIEDVPPVIICPTSVFVTAASPPPCKAVVNGLAPLSVTDNCGTPSVGYMISGATSTSGQTNASGLAFNAGVSSVVYTATDDCGNTSTCAFEVIVTCLPPCDTFSIILNTGWDNQTSTNITPVSLDLDGSPDLDWIVTVDPINPPPPGGRPADVCGTYGVGWAQPFSNSEWIAASPTWYESQLPSPPYLFTNEINFDLPAGYNYPNIELQLRADELIHTAYLNNNLIYQFFPPHVDGGFNGPPLIISNNTAAFFQTGPNKLSVSYSDESGDVTGFNLKGDVTYCKDTCQCGTFSDMAIRFERGPGQALACGGPPVVITCPPAGYSYTISGKFECQGHACPPTVPFEAQIEEPNGTITTISNLSANPYFGIPISNLYFQQSGVYTVTLTGQCGSQTCTCVLRFIIEDPCPDPCPCTIQDVQALGQAVNQGFASALSTFSCKGCFTPIALTDCETVEWFLNNTGGTPIGTSVGGNSFCYQFPGSGSYTVLMVVTRKKADGTNCETFVKTQTVTITCLIWDDCESVLDNPTFSEGAVSGGFNSGGMTRGWNAIMGEPEVIEGESGSVDGWSIQLSGNLDTADVLSRLEPVCLVKGPGTLRTTVKSSKSNSDNRIFPGTLKVMLGIGWSFPPAFTLNECDGANCFELASIQLPATDTAEWVEIIIPYDLSGWDIEEDCGGAVVRPILYVTNSISTDQGGEETYSYAQLDKVCFNGILSAVEDLASGQDFRIYPNPNTGEFTVELPAPAKQGMSMVIVSVTGQILFENQAVAGNAIQTIDAKNLAEGIYFLKIVSDGLVLSVNKFVKQ